MRHRIRSAPTRLILAAILLMAVAAATVGCNSASPVPQEVSDGPPNIIVILADDLGYGDVGFNGPSNARTPNLDRLAAQGVRFTKGYVAHSVCSPSRAAIMTGRHPARYGWEINPFHNPLDEHHGLDKDETLFPQYLRGAGYSTMAVGKWHLGAATPFNPLNRGFDHFYGFTGGNHDYFKVDVLSRGHGHLPLQDGRVASSFSGYLTDAFTDRAIEYVREERQNPFFLYLSYNAPHAPLQAPPELVNNYRHMEDGDTRLYLAMIESMDWNIGRLLDTLEQTGQRENTLIFFLSDNGANIPPATPGDNGPLQGAKGSLWEGGIRVPFVVSWPAEWPQGVDYEPMVSSMDIAATSLALAGATDFDPNRPLDGVNLDPYIRRHVAGSPHEALFWRGYSATVAVRAGNMKLVAGKELQLYDLASDPGETNNLAEDNRKTVVEMAMLWNAWNAENPGYSGFGRGQYRERLEEMMDDIAKLRRLRASQGEAHQIEVN